MDNVDTQKTEKFMMRLSKRDKSIIEANASKYGFTNLSEYIRFVTINSKVEVTREK